MAKVLISGGTGAIGQRLADVLRSQGHEVGLLSRSAGKQAEFQTYYWDPERNELDTEALKGCEYIIHLAGAGIADKAWTTKRKKEIIDSRVKSTDLLFNKVKELGTPLKAFVAASAVGYYGQLTSERIFREKNKAANDFVGKTCFLWEQASEQFEELGIRTVRLRIGIVLMEDAGALEQMARPVRMGLGAVLGSGRQYLPWVHWKDLVSLFVKAMSDPTMNGPYNAVAPSFVDNAEFTRTLGRVLGKPVWLPKAPGFVLKAILGERASLLLQGSRVSAEKVIASGFTFEFPELEPALADLLGS